VARLTRVEGLIAAARGDPALAERRLRAAADSWRRRLDRGEVGEAYAANLVDLGRPPIAGLIEPAHELARVLSDIETVRAVVS